MDETIGLLVFVNRDPVFCIVVLFAFIDTTIQYSIIKRDLRLASARPLPTNSARYIGPKIGSVVGVDLSSGGPCITTVTTRHPFLTTVAKTVAFCRVSAVIHIIQCRTTLQPSHRHRLVEHDHGQWPFGHASPLQYTQQGNYSKRPH